MAIHTPEMTAIDTVAADTETVPTGTVNDADTAAVIPADAASLTAPEGPGIAAPDADPAEDGDARVAAVWAALNAEPGASATMIGAAAGLSRMVAGKILNQLETNGYARREPGTNDGPTRGRAADRWYPITADTIGADTTAPDTEPPDSAPGAETPDADAVPASDEQADLAAYDLADAVPVEEPTDEADLIEEADGQAESLSADEATGQDSDRVDGELDSGPDTDASEPVFEPVANDPTWSRARAELTELANLFGGVISAKDEGNAVMALGCLEMAMAKVASAHRNARVALTGTAASARPVSVPRPGSGNGAGAGGGVRTGELRDLVHAHLIEFPGKDFTPYEIGKVLNRSSGAVANALDRLVSLGDAVLSCERPRRFALAPTANATDTLAEVPAGAAAPGTPAAPAEADAEGGVGTTTYGG